MVDNTDLKTVAIEVEKIFLSIRVQAKNIDIFETFLHSLEAIVSENSPINLQLMCENHPSSSQRIISKIISKGSDIEECIDEIRFLVSVL